MADDVKSELPLEPDLKAEIAHILLIDVVGFSRLLANDQVKIIKEVNRVVRGTERFRKAEEAGRLIRLPTGDGMVLLFFQSPDEPVRCAVEIGASLRNHPEIHVRMGIHSGPVNQVADVNDRPNFAGAGLNITQRVMDCADAGHILLSQHVADDLNHYAEWRPALHPLGECEVKHGYRLHIVNLWKDGVGNPAVPEKLRRRKRWRQNASRSPSAHAVEAPRWPALLIVFAALLSLVAVVLTFWILSYPPGSLPNGRQAFRDVIPEKSIAVLPFENLSDEKQDVYFADGVQDDILTNLAKVAALKVISRTSVMQYREGTKPRNLREIGKILGVAYALEGTVRRGGSKVRVTAQLIDARSDAHVWAEQFDREITDVFALQSEIAQKISEQLKVTLAPNEKAAIEEKPTSDLVAFDFYIRAKELIESAVLHAPRDEKLIRAVRLLDQATARDRSFADAYFLLSHAHDQIYFEGSDHTSERLQKSEAAIHSLEQLRPDSGEAHLAQAKHSYFAYFDYDRARRELRAVDGKLPNDPWPLIILGYVDRRQGKWEESTRNLERALELDPRNYAILNQIAISYERLGRYAQAIATLDRVLEIVPDDVVTRVSRAVIEVEWHANTQPLHDLIVALLAENPALAPVIADRWLDVAMWERDYAAADRAAAALTADGCRHEGFPFPPSWCKGMIAKARGDTVAAQVAFEDARASIAGIVDQQPNYAEAVCVLGILDAAMGNKESAIKNGQQAVKLFAPSGNAIEGAVALQYLALIYAWTGETDLACKTLTDAARTPGSVSYGELRLHPFWDSLRGDPKFEKIVASLAPR